LTNLGRAEFFDACHGFVGVP